MSKLFLDIETSGVDPSKHSILSIGIVIVINGFESFISFYEEIRYDELVISPDAIEVNKFDFKSQQNRIPLEKADNKAYDFVKKYFSKTNKAMAIGLNIGEFDLLFINKYMPKLSSLIDRRSVNLNSLIYLIADANFLDFTKLKEDLSQKAAATLDALALGLKKHNALYDALFHLSLYAEIKDFLACNRNKSI